MLNFEFWQPATSQFYKKRKKWKLFYNVKVGFSDYFKGLLMLLLQHCLLIVIFDLGCQVVSDMADVSDLIFDDLKKKLLGSFWWKLLLSLDKCWK